MQTSKKENSFFDSDQKSKLKISDNIKELADTLSQIERKILPFLNEDLETIQAKSGLDQVSAQRALQFLQNKKLVKLTTKQTKLVDLGKNGILYKKQGLPERVLLNLLAGKKDISLQEAKKQSKLSDNEFKAALGALKKKALLNIKQGKLTLQASMEEISKKSLEEQLLDSLPIELGKLAPEQQQALSQLQSRKNIIKIQDKKELTISITELGKQIMKSKPDSGLIEALTPEIIKSGSWKSKKFRRYDIVSPVPVIYGGKKHFVNSAIEKARKIWTELGFQEMAGNLIQSSFWNFDALFTAQDHPVRELQDTFYLPGKLKLPDKKLVKAVKQAHESGVSESKGWQYKWNEEEAKRLVLRTHTTCLSALTLYKLSKQKQKTGKFFAVGKCFRNETIDWSHGFEFNQTEGIVIDKNANFKNLLGYLQEFFKKMGYEKIRFAPAYFPYTEPSVEIHYFHPEKKLWLELGGAGIFRPEVVIPLLGENIPVLAWGPGFDRIIMEYYNIKDLREMYENNLTKLRKMKV